MMNEKMVVVVGLWVTRWVESSVWACLYHGLGATAGHVYTIISSQLNTSKCKDTKCTLYRL